MRWYLTNFYKFSKQSAQQLAAVEALVNAYAESSTRVRGLVLLAEEGCNVALAGDEEYVCALREQILSFFGGSEGVVPKDSVCDQPPFRKLVVKIKDEVLPIGWNLDPHTVDPQSYLSPADWHRILSDEDRRAEISLIDVRNDYEVEIGTFRDAIDPRIERFADFSDYVKKSALPKDKPVLMFCTGGIRCEKAAVEMRRQGYGQVFQLHGGILQYLEQFPEGHFQGECFVFDDRVAVTAELTPTEVYSFCPHCGKPADQPIDCRRCGVQAQLCRDCVNERDLHVCSKNCHYLFHKQQGKTQRLTAEEDRCSG